MGTMKESQISPDLSPPRPASSWNERKHDFCSLPPPISSWCAESQSRSGMLGQQQQQEPPGSSAWEAYSASSTKDRWMNHGVAASGEFVGTLLFLWMAYAGQLMVLSQASETATLGGLSSTTVVYISLTYAFALLVNVWAFYRISGGMFNPAVTLGLGLGGCVPWLRAAVVIPAQLLGAVAAGCLAKVMLPFDIAHANTTLSDRTTTAQGLFIEMVLTAELVFVVLVLAGEKAKHTFLAPLGIGLALFVAEIPGIVSNRPVEANISVSHTDPSRLGVFLTGGALNPARSFGCAAASGSFVSHHWIYWLGPVMGAMLSAVFYRFLKFAQYENANPGQDSAKGAFYYDRV